MVKTQNGEENLVLLKTLLMGNREIEQSEFRDTEEVFARLDEAEPE
jgi:hypothetical protein